MQAIPLQAMHSRQSKQMLLQTNGGFACNRRPISKTCLWFLKRWGMCGNMLTLSHGFMCLWRVQLKACAAMEGMAGDHNLLQAV